MGILRTELQESLYRLWRTVQRSWNLYRRSRLGLAGVVIILAFAVMAIFAPLISPFDPRFLAPDEDFFALNKINVTFGAALDYHEPVVGPTLPTYIVNDGGIWLITAQRSGIIQMILGRNPSGNETPFHRGNESFRFDVRALTRPPPNNFVHLEPPLSSVLYLVPGRTTTGALGPYLDNGVLAFVANSTFVVFDPFANRTLVAQDLGFVPDWIVQDPMSAGQLYDMPTQVERCFGAICVKQGPYRYLGVGGQNRLMVFRVSYLGRTNETVAPPVTILNLNVTLDRVPLLYYNIGSSTAISSGFFLPMNGTRLEIYDLTGVRRTTLNLTVGADPARLTVPVSFTRAPETPRLLAAVQSTANGTSAVLYINSDNVTAGKVSIARAFYLPSADMRIDTLLDSSPEGVAGSNFVYAVGNIYQGTTAVRAKAWRLTTNATVDPILQADLPEPIHDSYYVYEASRFFMLGNSGAIYSATTVSQGGVRAGLVTFFPLRPERQWIRLVGTFLGTIYASSRVPAQQVYGLAFEPTRGKMTVYQFVGNSLAPLPPGIYPSGNHYWLGTDNIGQDVLSWTIWGARVAFLVGVLAALSAVLVGTLVGLIAGYYGKIVDTLLMRTADIILVLPLLPIVIILTAVLGQNVLWIVVVIAVLAWPGIARVIRAQTLSLRERPFVDAARIGGASNLRIMFLHIAPNILPFTFLYMTLLVAGAILTEAALSFIGLGDAKAISWGQMLNTLNSSGSTTTAWWWLLPPGLAITVLSMGFYFVGRAVDEIVNPRLRER